MTALNKQALREAAIHAQSTDDWGCDDNNFHDQATPDVVLVLLDELEAAENTSSARLEAIDRTHKMFQRERGRADAAEKRNAELEARAVTVKRVGADQMHRVCLEATRHLDKYAAMAREVNKLLGSAVTNTTAAGIGVKGE
ncbi:ead/Ea22-like family protein [Salmonella enterica]|uniref:ead/Ea22-like family protein n=1 Tax=Salmonella enterica TaxID=28901 RepID=UPI001EE7B012|nr:ead/Ea22-like family protein [Salmonella enterica]